MTDIEATARQLQAEFGNLHHHGREGLDAWVVMVGHFTHIGWRPPECEHVWMAVKWETRDQTCSLCGATQHHMCTHDCPTPHETPTPEQIHEFDAEIAEIRARRVAEILCAPNVKITHHYYGPYGIEL
jgi:hypothetical protein